MIYEKIPVIMPTRGSPIRCKVEVSFQPNNLSDAFTCTYICDSLHQVIDTISQSAKTSRSHPFNLAVLGFYVYDCFYPLESIDDSPVDKDVLFYCIT